MGAGDEMVAGKTSQKPFQFMFTWQMQRQPFEEVATSPEPGAASALFIAGCCTTYQTTKWEYKVVHTIGGVNERGV